MSDVERLERRLAARVGRAIADFELVGPDDRLPLVEAAAVGEPDLGG